MINIFKTINTDIFQSNIISVMNMDIVLLCYRQIVLYHIK